MPCAIFRHAIAALAVLVAGAGCSRTADQPSGTGTADADGFSAPTALTAALNEKARAGAGRDDPESLADAQRGLVAAADTVRITDEGGRVIWDPRAFAFLSGDAPPSVHPRDRKSVV